MKLAMLVCWEDATRTVEAKEELLPKTFGYRPALRPPRGSPMTFTVDGQHSPFLPDSLERYSSALHTLRPRFGVRSRTCRPLANVTRRRERDDPHGRDPTNAGM
jgi:hypothetical protein